MADVARLDFSAPPPGAEVALLPAHLRRTIETAGVWGPRALAAAWAKYKAEHDPPGITIDPGGLLAGEPLSWVLLERGTDRARAWAWYERRLELAVKIERLASFMLSIGTRTHFDVWPRCLTWTDLQVDVIERWLARGGKLPEVLRG